MYFILFLLVAMLAGIGALITLIWLRVTDHMRHDPEAAELVAKHIIAPLLTGKKKEQKPEV